MRQILVLNSAQQDLYKIQSYTNEVWGNLKAVELQMIIDRAYTRLVFSPFVGRRTNKKDTFVLTLGKLPFVMIYKIDDEFIYITQVIHNKRNR